MASRFITFLSIVASAMLFSLVLTWAVVEIRSDMKRVINSRYEKQIESCGDVCQPDQLVQQSTAQKPTTAVEDCCVNTQPSASQEVEETYYENEELSDGR